MINYINDFSVSDNLRQSMWDDGACFPFTASELNSIEYINNCAKWHWHNFIELAFVVEGKVECCTPKGMITLSPGEGYFINANILHSNRMAASVSEAKYRVIQFEPSLLTGADTVSTKYVNPIIKNIQIESAMLSPSNEMGKEILDNLSTLFDIAANEPQPYELHLIRHITDLWINLFMLIKPDRNYDYLTTDTASSRIKQMIAFIHDNYRDSLTVDSIAAAANISRREAFRCFRQVLNTTPTLYLLQHRINCGARMLMETELTVTEVSISCGFASPSYFCKAFHDMTGVSPREFRKNSSQEVLHRSKTDRFS